MKNFLSCDWGTSTFRLRFVDVEKMEVLAEENTEQGIAATYALWRKLEDPDQKNRLSFYLDMVAKHIQKIESLLNNSLKGVPLIISGMASSSIGMLNLPYGQLPFKLDGSDVEVEFIKASEGFHHDTLLISGVKSENDVMRGEETQLIGSAVGLPTPEQEELFLFPGTHSKHIRVKDRQAVGFKTYMTGEFFALLSKKSILSLGVEEARDPQGEIYLKSFQEGVLAGVRENLLNASFLVRTNHLFEKLSKEENFTFLSGLLIGAELQELLPLTSIRIYLCGSSNLKFWYEHALHILGIHDRLQVFSSEWSEAAVIRGQYEIYHQFKAKG